MRKVMITEVTNGFMIDITEQDHPTRVEATYVASNVDKISQLLKEIFSEKK